MSKWQDGINEYAKELLEGYEEARAYDNDLQLTERTLLNGADNWQQYSEGGCSLIYDEDIAERLATPSEIKRQTRKYGLSEMANSRETWLEVQARALRQASRGVLRGRFRC